MSSGDIVLDTDQWNPLGVRYMAPRVNNNGGKSVTVISTQSKRFLHISTPLMTTWGISDYQNDDMVSDGRFTVSLNFPNEEFRTAATDKFLEKIKAFESKIIDDAVEHSELWFGEPLERGVVKHSFFPMVKYQKDKVSKKIDMSKPPSIKAKVTSPSEKSPDWKVEIYDTRDKVLFPSEDPMKTPVDFVPKFSQIACVLQCGGLWFGGKGWGITWRVLQCIVKPPPLQKVSGRCHIRLSVEDRQSIDNNEDDAGYDEIQPAIPEPEVKRQKQSAPVVAQTHVDDSDDDEPATVFTKPAPVVPASVPASVPATVSAPVRASVPVTPTTPSVDGDAESTGADTPISNGPKKVVKRVIKK